eukprot:TRINITY_DN34413_c0_g1_i1.p1 TRINITY_DN34413_c0_g1~~TRINITY_DN34413_c0_g1_i1.p1  ORF type:complete len:239 (-),score=22.71 TRINITY_DN34413_c0_g1_i1:121-837(-)
MVIPLDMAPGLFGPPPPELLSRFVKIRWCVLMMIFSVVGRLTAGIIFGHVFVAIASSSNLLMNTFVGVSLLRYDPYIGQLYSLGANTLCAICADLCESGMSCLHAFVLCNLATVVLDVLTSNALPLAVVGLADWPHASRVFCDKAGAPKGSAFDECSAGLMVFIISTFCGLVSQSIAAFHGWRALEQVRDMMDAMQVGDTGQDAFGREFPISRTTALTVADEPREFQAFSGRGHRLTD